jgi:hypothetical protein
MGLPLQSITSNITNYIIIPYNGVNRTPKLGRVYGYAPRLNYYFIEDCSADYWTTDWLARQNNTDVNNFLLFDCTNNLIS